MAQITRQTGPGKLDSICLMVGSGRPDIEKSTSPATADGSPVHRRRRLGACPLHLHRPSDLRLQPRPPPPRRLLPQPPPPPPPRPPPLPLPHQVRPLLPHALEARPRQVEVSFFLFFFHFFVRVFFLFFPKFVSF